jgi:hypothetical protein
MARRRDPPPNAAGATILAATKAEHTGYRVTILPTLLEVSARLATEEELKGLVKLLRANAAIWGKTDIREDFERPSLEIPEDDLRALRDIWKRLDPKASKSFPRGN